MRVLVVEDDSVHRFILTTIFQKSDDQVTAAKNGREALDILAEDQQFNIILTDIQMPEMDGIELLSRVRSNQITSMIPVIGFTAGDVNMYREKSATLFDALIAKPMDFWDLHTLAKRYVEGPTN
ncbi:response regulator [Algoriphagus sediminis]|uniref:Response regulator n=1 Tax=Algoriphagus sediminis TaxID=3057113 RepID=A0ABT7Y9A5_9BACT|nr:response regulator [Algoriphagus sediminis]MDN3203087.1 response regulator [Algoriphagus sediminis]